MNQILRATLTRTTLALIASLLFTSASFGQGSESQQDLARAPVAEKSALKILFVGSNPEAKVSAPSYVEGKAAERYAELRQERTPAFKSFLEQHFRDVTVLNSNDYEPAMSDAYDVTVFDAMPPAIEKIDMGNWTKQIRMPYDFDRPAIMVGNIAPMTLGRNAMGLRLDHL